jgi:transaldolase
MLFFIDSADINEIKELNKFGIIDGVTTNPTLFSKSGNDFHRHAKDICEVVTGPVSLEVGSTNYDEMVTEGEKIIKIAENVVLKLPMTWDGIRACKYFAHKGALVNMTLCFSSNQALLAAKAGAAYISPFIGRIDDIGQDGLSLIEDIQQIYQNYNFRTQILAASIRNTYHLQQVALMGADVATVPSKILKQMLNHPLTDQGIAKFSEDWIKSGLKI